MRRRRMVIALALALVSLAITLAACGGGDEETTTSAAPSAEAPGAEGSGDPIIDCIAQQGFDVQSPADINSPAAQQALQECHSGLGVP